MSDWPVAPLGNVLEAKYGKALPQAKRRVGAVPIYGSNGIVGFHESGITSGPTIVIGRKGSSGAVNFSSGPCWPIDTTYYIDDPGPFQIEFLDLLLRSLGLTDLDRSTAIPGLSRNQLYELEIPVPPSSEQAAIVTLLHAVDGRKQSAQSHLITAGRAAKRFRQAVLAAACAGRLTADWREANPGGEPVDATLSRIRSSREARLGKKYSDQPAVEGDSELPDTWRWVPMGSLVNVATGATPLRSRSDYYGGEVPWVTSGSVNAGFIVEAADYITDLALKETNVKLFPQGTLLVAMYGEGQTRGRVGELGITATTNQAVAALVFHDDEELLKPYLKLFLLENYERIRALSFGGVQPNLSLAVIRSTPVPLPPIAEQHEIVRRVDRLLKLADTLNQRVDSALTRVGRSGDVLLAKAFRGELVSDGGHGAPRNG
jgi:type I restriction enzyme S subunit